MPQSRYPLRQPQTRAQVIGMMIEGLSDREIASALAAKSLTISHQAVAQFRKRHAAEIAPVVAEVERQITDFAIANKVNRIAGLDDLAKRVQKWVEDRDLVELSEITLENGTSITRERFAREVSAELRAIYKAAAEELDQLPRGSTNVNIDNRTQVLIRQVSGYDGSLG